MKVCDVMTKEVLTVREDACVSDVARLLMEKGFSGVPVVNDSNEIIGIITESDLLPKMKKIPFSRIRVPVFFGEWLDAEDFDSLVEGAKSSKIADIMSTDLVTIAPEDEMGKAAELMTTHEIKRLPVVDGKKLVGMITRADIIRALV